MSKFTPSTEDAEDLAHGLSVLCVMDETGDTRTVWRADDIEATNLARKNFEAAKAKNMVAYLIPTETKGGDAGGSSEPVIVKSFDEVVDVQGRVVMAPALVGG